MVWLLKMKSFNGTVWLIHPRSSGTKWQDRIGPTEFATTARRSVMPISTLQARDLGED